MRYYNKSSPDSLAPTTRTFKLLDSCHRHFLIKFLLLLFFSSSILPCAPMALRAGLSCAPLYSKFSLTVGRSSARFCSGSCGAILFGFDFFTRCFDWSAGLQRFVFVAAAPQRVISRRTRERAEEVSGKKTRERPSTKHLSLLKGVEETKKKKFCFFERASTSFFWFRAQKPLKVRFEN